MTGTELKALRESLGIVAKDLSLFLHMQPDAVDTLESGLPYQQNLSAAEIVADALLRFEALDIKTAIQYYLRVEAEHNPYSDYDAEYGAEVAEKMKQGVFAHHRIIQQLKRVKEPPVGQQLYTVTFASGETQDEYGTSESDVREFIQRSFAYKGAIKSIVLYTV